MKKTMIIVFGILASICLVLAAFLGYMGMLSSPVVYEREMGPFTFAYDEFRGAYKDTGPVFDRVNRALAGEGIHPTRAMGIYYDDPFVVPEEKLRSRCGSVIEGDDMAVLNRVKDKFKILTIGKSACVVTEFPVKNPLSYMMGPMKSYTALAAYASQKGYRTADYAYELYDIPGGKIYYFFSLVR